MQKYKYIYQTKYTEAVVLNSTRILLWFETSKMLIALQYKKKKIYCVILFILLFGTLSLPVDRSVSTDADSVGLASDGFSVRAADVAADGAVGVRTGARTVLWARCMTTHTHARRQY